MNISRKLQPLFRDRSLLNRLKFLWLAFFSKKVTGGDDGIRTHDPLLAGQVLSQLSYTPIIKLLGFAVSILSQSVGLLGRPKWTRTTDLVLIRHAL